MKLSGNDKRILWTSFFAIWIVIWIRAAAIPVFPDEVFSWLLYGESGYFFPPEAQVDANNHFLNSILTFSSAQLFGVSALSIRLPNVLAFALFFLSAVKISSFQRSRSGFYISLISLGGVFYMLEFFSLSRGYGLSLAFLLLSVWQLMEYQQNLKTGRLILLVLSVMFALGSNLSLLFAYAAILAWLPLIVAVRRKEFAVGKLLVHIFLILLFAGIFFAFYRYAAYLKELDMLYYGVTGNFPFATIGTLLTEIFGADWFGLYYFLLLLTLMLFSGLIVLIFRNGLKAALSNRRFVFPVLFMASAGGITFSVLVLKTPAPSDRTALHLIPLFCGSLAFIFTSFDRKTIISYLQLSALVFPLATAWRFNLNNHHFWRADQLSSAIYDKLQDETKAAEKPVTISGFRYFDRTYAFEFLRRKGRIPVYDLAAWNSGKSDYLLLRPVEMKEKIVRNYKVIATDPVSGNSLLKRKTILPKMEADRIYSSAAAGENEFLEIFRIRLDSVLSGDFVADISLHLPFEESGERFLMTSAINDSTGKVLRMTEHFRLNQLRSDWTNSQNVHFAIPFHGIPEEATTIVLYIYNNRKVKHREFRALTKICALGQ